MTTRLAAVHLEICLALSIASVALANAQTPPPQWAGWARCQITVSGPGYNDTQTHTWTMTGGAPSVEGAFRVYPATWSVVGGGALQGTQGNQTRVAQWARTVAGMSAPLAVFVRASDGRMFIQARHAQLRAASSVNGFQQLTIDGVAQKPVAIAAEAFEWTFPTIEVTSTTNTINGSSTPAVTGSVGLMQPGGSQGTASCTWQFGQGAAAPAPPPTLTAQAIPTPPASGSAPPAGAATNPPPQAPPPTSTAPPTSSLPTTQQPRNLPVAPPAQGFTAIPACTLRGPTLNSYTQAVPNTAHLSWSAIPGATGYNVYRNDIGLLTPSPLAANRTTYDHRALLNTNSYSYSVVALYANGCGVTTKNLQGTVNTINLSLSVGSNAGQVNIIWSVQNDGNATGAILQGPGLPAAGLDVKRSAVSSSSRATGAALATGVPKGQQTYTATVYWDAPGGQYTRQYSSTVTVP